jgi:uncharacterized coiled-coil DUF342 family protein
MSQTNTSQEQQTTDTRSIFEKVKERRNANKKKIGSGFEEYNQKHIRIQREIEALESLREVKDLVNSMIQKKIELLQAEGVVI